MADIMDYIDWRGDIGFDEVHVNEVDGLIFSQLIYVQMKPYMPDAKKSYLTIKQLSSLYCADHSDDEIEQMPNLFRHSARLLQKLAHSRRYADCILRYYIYDISEKEESQFSAVTIELPDGTYFISYSGTDHSVVGWKENFNLSYLDETPGQNKAKKYLKQVAAYICNDDRGINEKAINDKALDDENINNKSINTRKLWIGGHSKGGNLAVFAVYMAGTMLGPVWGAASQLVYLLLAAVGVPVMAGMQGGPAVLLGKTGGYAIGYLLAALIAGAFAAKLPRKFGWLALGCVVGCAACYVLGTIWFMVLTGLDLPTSLTYCVIPYLPGDVIKIALASLLTIQLDKRVPKI